ncbi:DUF3800 domain-containing protein [uncultured Psychroserpens sp.]|uniref:DUF3800 domain-containing protein n=1 Tax=uncultured Psychroserpens sp. TaxID=255436 RepID=UPI0026296D60|nr:DUF3800 domain-containing protein [uncultured Psychroserpens sp.]
MRYFVFIDETGEANINNLDPRYNIFALCGVVFREDHYNRFDTELKDLKRKLFGNEDVILHSYTMRKNKGAFKVFQDKKVLNEFYNGIEKIFTQHTYKVISCIVNKEEYKKKYPLHNFAYEDALKFLCERSISSIGENNKKQTLHFCLEKRGNRKDRDLKKLYTKIVRYGTDYKSTDDFKVCHPNLFFRAKNQNINGLQLADLCAYPIARKVLSPERSQPTYDLFENKIYRSRYGEKRGYGLKFFP